MSWVDLAVLSAVLWSAVGGYLGGLRRAAFRLVGHLLALLWAVLLNSSLILYVNREWRAESVLTAYLTSRGEVAVLSGTGDLHRLLQEARLRLAPGSALPVTAQVEPVNQAAGLLVWALSLTALFLLGLSAVSLVQNSFAGRKRGQAAPPGRSLPALMVGALSGIMLALFLCLAAAALCLLPWSGFLLQALQDSYLLMFSRTVIPGIR